MSEPRRLNPRGKENSAKVLQSPRKVPAAGSLHVTTTGQPLTEEEAATSTTIAIGNDTYTIVASRKPSTGSQGNAGAKMVDRDKDSIMNTATNGETIRVFRRSRTGKPPTGLPAGGLEDCENVFHSSSSSAAATTTEDLPDPDCPRAVKEASAKLEQLLTKLKGLVRGEDVDPATLIPNLEYVLDVVQSIAAKTETEDESEDDLSELQSESVPDEVRKWLASTFAKQDPPARRSEERPSFRSVANAIRTGIFIERIYRRMSSSQLMDIPPDVQKAVKGINNWSFDTFRLNVVSKGAPLRYLGYEILTRHGCLHKYKMPPSLLETMLIHLEAGYMSNGNPYHNNLHACDVLQTMHFFISQLGLSNWMSDLEIFTSLMAAIIHDFDHSGTTNNFHVNSSSALAILYNDRSVLENHHVSAFFRMIQEQDCSIFNNMQETDFREFRNLIIDMVLHTDMSQHFSQLKGMKSILQQHNLGEPSFDKNKVLNLLLHSCDVSHPAKAWSVHHQFTSRCMEEFFVQGDREADLGLEYSPLCDRANTVVPQSQIGFIDFIVNPTLTVLGDCLEAILSPLTCPRRKILEESNEDSDSKNGKALYRPWTEVLPTNKAKWQDFQDKGERGIALPNESWYQFSRPGSAKSATSSSDRSASAGSSSAHSSAIMANARVRMKESLTIQQKRTEGSNGDSKGGGLYQITGPAPSKDTAVTDVVEGMSPKVMSKPGSPDTWSFNDKDVSLEATPPRLTSATLCSPPIPRKVPISIDHHLRK